MPQTVNGIGTHYYGKKNRTVRNAHCQHCSRFGPLESYDTRLWFVVVFLPVIPFGRKRIIDACASCTRHMVMDADKYEQARQLQISGSLERYRREATPEAALHAHAQLLAFHEYEQAESIRRQALDRFTDDAPFRVALASHMRQASFYDEMVTLFRAAHELDPELPEARAGVALTTMAQGQLDEARQLLDFLEEPGVGATADMEPLFSLAGKFAAAGRHAEALDLYAILLRELPHLGQRSDFRDQVRKSEKAAKKLAERFDADGSVLPPRQHSLKGLFVADGSTYTKGQRNAVLIGLAVLLGGGGLAISNEFIRRNRTIRVVNAGDPIQVRVDDGPTQPIGTGLGSIAVAEGKHRLTVSGPVPETHDVELTSGYFERWTESPAWVLNPGREAVLEQIRITYSAVPTPPQQTLIVGRSFVTLPDVDYLFTDPPDSMRIKGKDKVITKEVLRWAQDEDLAAFQQALSVNRAAALDFAEKRLRRRPEDKGLFQAYLSQTYTDDRPRADAFLQSGLKRKPLSIPWHRAAQAFASEDERKRMVVAYDATLAAEPKNAAVIYLRGRSETDPDRRAEFYHRSIAADPMLSWPVMALGSTALSRGEWQEALDLARRAEVLQVDPDVSSQVIHTARMALGQAETLVKEYRSRLQSTPFDLRTLVFLFEALAAAGRPGEIDSEQANIENRLPPEARSAVGPMLRALAIYTAGQPGPIEQFVKERLPSVGPEIRTVLLLAAGPASVVLATPNLDKPSDPWLAAALALGLALEGKDDDAKAALDRTIGLIETRPDEDRQLADFLRATEPPAIEAVLRVFSLPAEKAVLFALLGERFPDRRADYRAAAARFNVRRSAPYLLVRRATEAGAAPRP